MTPDQFRANAAGYIDSACMLVDEVVRTLDHPEGKKRATVPAALFEQLKEARRIMSQCAEWMISPHNSALESTGGARLAKDAAP